MCEAFGSSMSRLSLAFLKRAGGDVGQRQLVGHVPVGRGAVRCSWANLRHDPGARQIDDGEGAVS